LSPDEVVPTAFQSRIVGRGGGEAPPLLFSGEGEGKLRPCNAVGTTSSGDI